MTVRALEGILGGFVCFFPLKNAQAPCMLSFGQGLLLGGEGKDFRWILYLL